VIHYDIYLDDINIPAKILRAHTRIELLPAFPGLTEIRLELLKLTVDSVFLDGIIQTINYNDTLITVNLPSPAGMTDTLRLAVYYHGTPHIEAGGWGGFHFSGSTAAYNLGIALNEIPHNFGRVWFACNDNFTDKATYDFFITVPSNLMAVCNGNLISSNVIPGGSKLFHWKLDTEIPAYLASVAINNYVPVNGNYAGLNGLIPTQLYVKPADTGKAKGSFIHLNQVLSIFENRFGPYRWPRVGFTATGIGAMEHATNIAYPSASINGTLSDESLYCHELSHAWFGNLVTCESPQDMWFNEGWAVFCESVAIEGLYGPSAYKNNIRSKHHAVLQKTHITDGGYLPLAGMPEAHTYGSTVYDKGGMVVHSLRGFLGDSLFFASTKTLLDSFAFQNVNSTQIRDLFQSTTSLNINGFFQDWVFSPGFPHYEIDSFRVIPAGQNFEVSVFLQQRQKGTSQPFTTNRFEIGFLGSNWEYQLNTVEFQGTHAVETFLLPFHPVSIFTDPEEKTGDATTDYYSVIKTPGTKAFPDTYFTLITQQISDSALVRVTHHWIAPDSLQPEVPGLRLSPLRFWTIEGLIPQGFAARGKFYYSQFGYLDNTLITNMQDSLVLLYRPNKAAAWQGVSFTTDGSPSQGELITDHLFPGEYTLAIWDHHYLSMEEFSTQESALKIYPNPAKGAVNIKMSPQQAATIRIRNAEGKIIDTLVVSPGQTRLVWQPSKPAPATYFFEVIAPGKGILSRAKVVIIP
jgi:aminopeptidase N